MSPNRCGFSHRIVYQSVKLAVAPLLFLLTPVAAPCGPGLDEDQIQPPLQARPHRFIVYNQRVDDDKALKLICQ